MVVLTLIKLSILRYLTTYYNFKLDNSTKKIKIEFKHNSRVPFRFIATDNEKI